MLPSRRISQTRRCLDPVDELPLGVCRISVRGKVQVAVQNANGVVDSESPLVSNDRQNERLSRGAPRVAVSSNHLESMPRLGPHYIRASAVPKRVIAVDVCLHQGQDE